ncbi:hypothetical protein ABVT39_018097 [Epinephelus coioides]
MVQVERSKDPQDPQAPMDVRPIAPPLPTSPPPYPQDTSPSETGQYPLRSVGEARAVTTMEGQVEGRGPRGGGVEADLGEDQQAKEDGEGDRAFLQDPSHRNSKPISKPHPISNWAPRK